MADADDEFLDQHAPSQTNDEFLNQYAPKPDVTDVLAKYSPQWAAQKQAHQELQKNAPYEGPTSDAMFSNSPLGHILTAMGVGAKQQWGEKDQYLQADWKKGGPLDADKNDGILKKAFNTGIMRPLAGAIDYAQKVVSGLGGATFSGLEQASQEVGGPVGEDISGIAHGAGLEAPMEIPEIGFKDSTQILQDARAHAVTGEGEEGFFGVTKPTPEQVEERTDAAHQAGITIPEYDPKSFFQTETNLPTTEDLARQVNPDVFNQLDRLKSTQAELTQTLHDPDLLSYNRRVSGTDGMDQVRARLQDIDYQLRDLIPDVSAAKNRVQEMLEGTGPEGAAYRDFVQAQAFENALRYEELKPEFTDAIGHSNDLLESGEQIKGSEGTGKKSLKSEPVVDDIQDNQDNQKDIESELAPTTEGTTLKGLSGDATKESGAYRNFAVDAVRRGLLADDEARLEGPKYTEMNRQYQAEKAVDFDIENPKDAEDVAMRLKEPPGDLHPESVFRAVYERAIRDNDLNLVQKLSTSGIYKERSILAQRLGSGVTPYSDDPAQLMASVALAKQKAKSQYKIGPVGLATKDPLKETQGILNQIQSSAQAAIQKFKPDNEAFLRSIECK